MSLAVFFTIVLGALSSGLPGADLDRASKCGSLATDSAFNNLSPSSALFATFLGADPVQSLLAALPASTFAAIPAATKTLLLGNTFFPNAIAPAFISALRIAFYVGAALSAIAAVTSSLRGDAKPPSQVEPKLEAVHVSAKQTVLPSGDTTHPEGAAK